MTSPSESVPSTPSSTPLTHLSPATLLSLRAALLTRADLDTVFTLRDAGYAGGDQLYAAFETFVRDRGAADPHTLSITDFFRHAGDFLTACGWGRTTLSTLDDPPGETAFCVIDIAECWEAAPDHQPDPRGCHLTLGALGAFLGKFADYPLSVLEVEGPATGSTTCRFLAGNTEMVADYYAKNS